MNTQYLPGAEPTFALPTAPATMTVTIAGETLVLVRCGKMQIVSGVAGDNGPLAMMIVTVPGIDGGMFMPLNAPASRHMAEQLLLLSDYLDNQGDLK